MLSVKDISFSYKNSKKAIFEGHTFSLKQGEVLAILGTNGSGKTTLLKALLNLLPLDKGEIKIDGTFSYVPQETLSPFDYSVQEMVLMGRSSKNGLFAVPNKIDYEKTKEVLAEVGMLHTLNDSFCNLSGGQKQMILIARALVSNPDIIMLDEPCSALDYNNQDKVLEAISKVSKQGKIVIFTTHCPLQALHVSHKTLLVRKAEASTFGDSNEILNEDSLSSLYKIPIRRYQIQSDNIIVPSYNKNSKIIKTLL